MICINYNNPTRITQSIDWLESPVPPALASHLISLTICGSLTWNIPKSTQTSNSGVALEESDRLKDKVTRSSMSQVKINAHDQGESTKPLNK